MYTLADRHVLDLYIVSHILSVQHHTSRRYCKQDSQSESKSELCKSHAFDLMSLWILWFQSERFIVVGFKCQRAAVQYSTFLYPCPLRKCI